MEAADILLVVLLVAATAACAVAIWAMRELASTAKALRALSDDTRLRLVPLLEKVDVTVDAVNAELLRVDAIITQMEEASARVSHASDTISDIVSAPGDIVNDVASRVRRAWKDRRRTEAAESGEEQSEQVDEPRVDETPGAQSVSAAEEPSRDSATRDTESVHDDR